VRAMKVVRGESPPQDDVPDTMNRYTAAKRAVILEEILAELVRLRPEVVRLASALERRAV
jgi:hypothetical protein